MAISAMGDSLEIISEQNVSQPVRFNLAAIWLNEMEWNSCLGAGWSEYGRRSSWWAIITYKVIKDIGRQRWRWRRQRTTAEDDEDPGTGGGQAGRQAGRKTDRLGNATFT